MNNNNQKNILIYFLIYYDLISLFSFSFFDLQKWSTYFTNLNLKMIHFQTNGSLEIECRWVQKELSNVTTVVENDSNILTSFCKIPFDVGKSPSPACKKQCDKYVNIMIN